MADQVQIPESGGGEGAVPLTPAAFSSQPPSAEAPKAETLVEVKVEVAKPVVPNEVTSVEAKPDKPVEVTTVQPPPAQPEQPIDLKQEPDQMEHKVPQLPEQSNQTAEVKTEANGDAEKIILSNEQGDWQQRETELLKKIEELEMIKKERTQESFQLELKVREEEIDLLKARVKNLETELQAALSKPSGKNHEMIENIKQQHEELLSKARGMIFDKTKMVKNQELQIEALTTQIQSLKDINQITKDLLEIRNSEIKAMEDRLAAMEARFKAEKERYGLVLQRAQTSSNINDDLRKEYETQLQLFKELREKYDQRVQALVAENERLKGSAAASGAGPSG